MHRFDESLASYRRALELDPRDVAAYNNDGAITVGLSVSLAAGTVVGDPVFTGGAFGPEAGLFMAVAEGWLERGDATRAEEPGAGHQLRAATTFLKISSMEPTPMTVFMMPFLE